MRQQQIEGQFVSMTLFVIDIHKVISIELSNLHSAFPIDYDMCGFSWSNHILINDLGIRTMALQKTIDKITQKIQIPAEFILLLEFSFRRFVDGFGESFVDLDPYMDSATSFWCRRIFMDSNHPFCSASHVSSLKI